MWDLNGNRKGRKRGKHRNAFHVKRVTAHLEVNPNERTAIRMILNDFTTTGGGFFSEIFITPGVEVRIILTEPEVITILGTVIWCHEHNMNSHIISEEKFSFRMGIEFKFEKPEEKQTLELLHANILKNFLFNGRPI